VKKVSGPPHIYVITVQGHDVFLGGDFDTIGTVAATSLAKWNTQTRTMSAVGGASETVNAIVAFGSDVYVGGYLTIPGISGGTIIGKWDGSSWTRVCASGYITKMAVKTPTEIYAAGNVPTSFDPLGRWDGAQWHPLPDPPTNINALALVGDDLYVGGAIHSVGGKASSAIAKWNTSLTGVGETTPSLPIAFHLSQNYPNPFNPTTRISFQLPTSGFVTLRVFDVLGREVATLAHEHLKTGTYTREFNATNLASGIYFATLDGVSFTKSIKMLLIR